MIENICKDCTGRFNNSCTKIAHMHVDINWIEQCLIQEDKERRMINVKRLQNYCRYSGRILKELNEKMNGN